MNMLKWFTLLLVMATGVFSAINPVPSLIWAFILCCILAVLSFAFSPRNDSE